MFHGKLGLWEVVLLLALIAPTVAFAEQNSPFGVVSAGGIANDVCRQNDLSALGAGWVRSGWSWPSVEVAQDDFKCALKGDATL
jgi:hypothetical protein